MDDADRSIRETAIVLQDTMNDVLRRLAVTEALEELAIGKVDQDDRILTLLAFEYRRAQFVDLRKFFENREDSHRLKDLTAKLASPELKSSHSALFEQWKNNYQDIANKFDMHREKGYEPSEGVSYAALGHFIRDVQVLLIRIVKELNNEGFNVPSKMETADYFQEIKEDAIRFYTRVAKSSQ